MAEHVLVYVPVPNTVDKPSGQEAKYQFLQIFYYSTCNFWDYGPQ